jgi:phosphosulfolactate synthase (CoM biosynthesis protein A)
MTQERINQVAMLFAMKRVWDMKPPYGGTNFEKYVADAAADHGVSPQEFAEFIEIALAKIAEKASEKLRAIHSPRKKSFGFKP